METHYVCTGGCGGESEVSEVCGDPGCLMYNMDFATCACEDGRHLAVLCAKPADMEDHQEGLKGMADDIEIDPDEVMKWEDEFGDEKQERAYN